MKEVEDAMREDAGGDDAEAAFVSEYGERREAEGDENLEEKTAARGADRGEEDVERRDDHENRGIEGTIAMEAHDAGEQQNRRRKENPNRICHCGEGIRLREALAKRFDTQATRRAARTSDSFLVTSNSK